MPESMASRRADSPPLAADEIVRGRHAPNAEHQQVCRNYEGPVVADVDSLLHREAEEAFFRRRRTTK